MPIDISAKLKLFTPDSLTVHYPFFFDVDSAKLRKLGYYGCTQYTLSFEQTFLHLTEDYGSREAEVRRALTLCDRSLIVHTTNGNQESQPYAAFRLRDAEWSPPGLDQFGR